MKSNPFIWKTALWVFCGGFLYLHPWRLAAQNKRDVIVKYLDSNLSFTRKAHAAYEAVVVRDQDHWQLIALFPDATPFIKVYYKDKSLTIKDGPFTLYYGSERKAIEGYYLENAREGVWKYRYPSGLLKDSGMIVHDAYSGTWKGWHENGQLRSVAEYLPQQGQTGNSPAHSGEWEATSIFSGEPVQAILHGSFMAYHENGQLQEKGMYAAGKKAGFWEFYYLNGGPDCKGSFENDVPTAEWEFFHENGQVSTKETYVNGKVSALSCYDRSGIYTGSMCNIRKPPVPIIDRYTDFTTYMYDHLEWPEALKGQSVNGIVQVEFTISKEGILKNIEVKESPHPLISEEVIRFFHSIPQWSPAISHNRAIDFTQQLRIPFYR